MNRDCAVFEANTKPRGLAFQRGLSLPRRLGESLKLGERIVSESVGILCVSIDNSDHQVDSLEHTQRRRELISLMRRFDLPGNWTIEGHDRREIPANAEVTLAVSKSISRADLIATIQRTSVSLMRDGKTLKSVVMDPHEARERWDILQRHGCVVARSRTSESTHEAGARILRGGLWAVSITCSFVGGTRRSVRSLFSVCQRHLVESAATGRLFHLNVNLSNKRDSWSEEREALRALFETANEQRKKGRLRCVRLGDVPATLTRKNDRPMNSILRRAA